MVYIVSEIQTSGDTASILNFTYTDYDQACSKYHTILSFAATSNVPKHSTVIANDDGSIVKRETYIHEQ